MHNAEISKKMRIRAWLLLTILGLAAGIFLFWLTQYSAPVGGSELTVAEQTDLGQAITQPASREVFRFYRIMVELDPDQRQLKGVCRLNLRNDQALPYQELYFHLYPNAFQDSQLTPAPPAAYRAGFSPGGMDLTEVRVEGMPVKTEVNGTLLKIWLPRPLLTGQSTTVEISFSVTIPQAAYRFGHFNGVTMLSNWYPILAVRDGAGWHLDPYSRLGDPFYSQVSDYEVTILLPADQVVAATGWVEAETAVSPAKKRIRLRAQQVRDFALVTSADFRVIFEPVNGVTVYSYYLPGHESGGELALQAAKRTLQYYNRTLCPYPYPQFSVIEVPMEGFEGMEYPMLAYLNSRYYTSKFSVRDWEPLVAHEVAHQWWYGLVGSDQYREAWLDEGLAVWLAEQYLRDQYGQAGYQRNSSRLKKATSLGPILRPLGEYTDREEYYALAYYGGSLFWEELEGELGPAKVQEIWHYLLWHYQYQEINTRLVLEAVNQVTADDYRDYFLARLGGLPGELTVGKAQGPETDEAGPTTASLPDTWALEPRTGVLPEDLGSYAELVNQEPAEIAWPEQSPGPDLIIKNLSLIERGEQCHLIIQVANLGDQAAGQFTVQVENEAGVIWQQKLAGLPAGKVYTFGCSGSFPSGWVNVDAHNEVAESNEQNNRRVYSIDR
ncbi:MAG: hypothetical protein GX755_09465 [Syntrophomonadaceae bacterium]|nr:hypothetical protein [Syntrophomonadaceae bacterium]